MKCHDVNFPLFSLLILTMLMFWRVQKVRFCWFSIVFTDVWWNLKFVTSEGHWLYWFWWFSGAWLFFIFLRFFNDFDVLRCSENVFFWFSQGFYSKSQVSRIHALEAWFWRLDNDQNHEISWFQFSFIFLANINNLGVLDGAFWRATLIFVKKPLDVCKNTSRRSVHIRGCSGCVLQRFIFCNWSLEILRFWYFAVCHVFNFALFSLPISSITYIVTLCFDSADFYFVTPARIKTQRDNIRNTW